MTTDLHGQLVVRPKPVVPPRQTSRRNFLRVTDWDVIYGSIQLAIRLVKLPYRRGNEQTFSQGTLTREERPKGDIASNDYITYSCA